MSRKYERKAREGEKDSSSSYRVSCGTKKRRTRSDTGVHACGVADQALSAGLEEEAAVGDLALRCPGSSVRSAVPSTRIGEVSDGRWKGTVEEAAYVSR